MTTMKLKRAVTRIQNLRAAKGGWAIEATGALGLLVLLVGFSMYNETRGNDRKMAEIAATHHKTVATAASAYVRDHYSDLLTAVPAVGNTTTVSFATLQANGYLQPTLSSSNIWGQTLTLRVRRLSADPKAVQLEALVIGEGGKGVGHELAREVSQNIGAEGGYTVASGDYCGTTRVGASTLCGTRGVWQRPVADFGAAIPAGHIASALFFKDGMAVNDYLYRHRVPGKPELNTMETYLQMGTGARAVEGQPCYSVSGDASSPLLDNGAIATTSDGLILSCQSGIWRGSTNSSVGFCPNATLRDGTTGTYANPVDSGCTWILYGNTMMDKNAYMYAYMDGVLIGRSVGPNSSKTDMLTVIIPPGHSGRITGSGSVLIFN